MSGYFRKQPASYRVIVFLVILLVLPAASAQEGRPAAATPLTENTVSTISPEESRRRMEDAMVLFEKGKTDAAIYMLQQVEKADPANYEVLFKLGEMAINSKNWAYSIEVLRKASFLRPEDIEVRLILMDIYKAYQMPIQEIVVGREILALDPNHRVASRRLAELYHEQAMLEDEIRIRQHLKDLAPEDYANSRRLAEILAENAQMWESARVYELIRKHHPDKVNDLGRLASIYESLGENFRAAEVLDDIDRHGGNMSWMDRQVETNLRAENNIFDPLTAAFTFQVENERTLDIYSYKPQAAYTRLRVRSSIDFGIAAKYTLLNHHGVGLLDGEMDINSTSVVLSAIQNWSGQDYVLAASAGFIHDNVSGRLFARNNNPLATPEDFPFLADPTFNSYGGTIPIGAVQFLARPNLNMTYSVNYAHQLVEDLSARLELFYQDRFSLGVRYEADDRTTVQLEVDNSFISDGNFRFHTRLGAYYNLWADQEIHDYRGRRQGYFRNPPASFVRLGYEFELFVDDHAADQNRYETFRRPEYRNKGVLMGQALLMDIGPDEQLLFNVQLAYGAGRTLSYRGSALARLFYFNPQSENEFGLSYGYQSEDSTNQPDDNLQIGGRTITNKVSLYVNWRF